MMDRKAFYAALRKDKRVFGTSLSQAQVDGLDAYLDAFPKWKVTDIHHASNILAQGTHETGGNVSPIKETVMPHHKNKNPSDATVIARLDRAYAKGHLPWVSKPYWRDGAFGRGGIQLTHWYNYIRLGKRLGIPLRENPNLAMKPDISADIAIVGMMEGLFTGKKLPDYNLPSDLENNSTGHPRRIVNGKDGTDRKINRYHWAFHDALEAAGWGKPASQELKPPQSSEKPQTPKTSSVPMTVATALAALIAAIAGAFGENTFSFWDTIKGILQ